LGAGKGASFLSDIREIRNSFDVSLEPDEDPTHHRLRLVPREAAYDIDAVYLFVSKAGFIVDRVVTHNDYGDITRISLTDYTFDDPLPEEIFDLEVPPGTDMIEMDGG
jgi:outer membrane lipoprotein carrier protein